MSAYNYAKSWNRHLFIREKLIQIVGEIFGFGESFGFKDLLEML